MQINEKFYMLPKEKQQIIINAGLECFGQYGYQKANTERIALKAGISKALLFHYFINKKNFYLWYKTKNRIDCGIYAGRTCSNTG